MSSNCIEIVDFGCVSHCSFLKIPIRPLRDGNYRLRFSFGGAKHDYSTRGKAGKYLVWSENPLPVGKKVLFQILDDFGKNLFYSFLKDDLGLDFSNYCADDCEEPCITQFAIKSEMIYSNEPCDCGPEFYDPCSDCGC